MLRKGTKSFGEWCVENNKIKYIKMWDAELNKKDIFDVAKTASKKYYFKCEKGIHDSYLKGINNLVFSKDLLCPQCNSFYQWCLDNNRNDIIMSWDNEKNKDNIKFVSKASGKKYWFTINDIVKHSYLLSIDSITSTDKLMDPLKRYYGSFGWYVVSEFGKEYLDKIWSTKNKKSPFDFYKRSKQKIWLNCLEKPYHEDYKTNCDSFFSGGRCSYCSSKKIHPRDSFAQYNIDRFGEEWLKKCWVSDNNYDPWKLAKHSGAKKIKMRCREKDYHVFMTNPSTYISSDICCPYCSSHRLHKLDSLGTLYPDINDIWSDKNEKSPFEYYTSSHERVWLKCKDEKHEDYLKIVSDYTSNKSTMCPECVRERKESFLQEKVRKYFIDKGFALRHETKCSCVPINPNTNMPMPFDNEIIELKTIVEVNGKQHYEQCGFHIMQSKKSGKTPQEEFEYQLWKDDYKKEYATKNGYSFLIIPYWEEENDKYKETIDNFLLNMQ